MSRMSDALALADKCWEKAYRVAPEFVEEYLSAAYELLLKKPVVKGDEFKAYCRDRGVFLPDGLHPNSWVSGVNALKSIGWLVHAGYDEPTKSHNHMPRVSLWRSTVYGKPEAET